MTNETGRRGVLTPEQRAAGIAAGLRRFPGQVVEVWPDQPPSDVTPEMVEAALPHLYRYHPDHGAGDEETVAAIYRAMQAARTRTG